MAKLWTFGCSMTWGAELFEPQMDRWSKVLADQLGLTDENHGRSGSSNFYVHRRITDVFEQISTDDLTVIMWTDPLRYEFIIPFASMNNGFATISPEGENMFGIGKATEEELNTYYSMVGNFYRNMITPELAKVQSMQMQYSIYKLFEATGKKVVFCFWKSDHWDDTRFSVRVNRLENDLGNKKAVFEQFPYYKKKYDEINNSPSCYTDKFFLKDAKRNGYEVGAIGTHPLEGGHEWFGNLLYEHIIANDLQP